MSLKEQISNDIKTAMKEKNVALRDALRLLSSAMKQIEVDERKELSDDDIIKIIQKQVKQRNDAMSQYRDAGREDLYEKEASEAAIFETYLPAQLSDEALESALRTIIAETGAESIKDIGRVMGAASKALGAQADGKRINECAKKILG
ncbi:MAG: glutamyl-tRNA amidotransferase [Sulfuricurvum sp. GWF2_44_89]|uniref:Glutamyl-tRNA amidotransferase n=1 Tax=Sulfuricurvum kujiense TaxID=148813 RepID=A0A2D3WNM0_9BACT|nr:MULTISPECIES: GatB/YqeY domain-containing protein [Sulfuricurvum]OHD78772.1 MAG: glutamyl-tRNA amidotransferase [Sulfuricurvum sp. GWF2_44_89]OHD91552.1 MAG: glutamyl-tRNA amidotransferase [Sulfuricurvum sp. RIFOXYD12_FULL_44_77]OHD94914.1 MAG: glutamyl-tRNA amidotransferase [Sulfuricurvum sp. RIFOXYD2_FULL_44_160]DAB38829.1 MAG TPA: glutamyl-tRNA amidotransferase [Sulfuricurvum kujiense]